MARAPFKLTAPAPYEVDIHEACAQALDQLLLPPAEFCCYPAGHIQLSAAQVARLARAGLKRAYPDLLLFYHAVWGIEIKRRQGGRLSKTRITRTTRGSPRILIGQEEMFPRLLATGAFAAIATVSSVDEMLAQVQRWGIPLRPIVSPLPARASSARVFV